MEAITGLMFFVAPYAIAAALLFMGFLLLARTTYRYATAPAGAR